MRLRDLLPSLLTPPPLITSSHRHPFSWYDSLRNRTVVGDGRWAMDGERRTCYAHINCGCDCFNSKPNARIGNLNIQIKINSIQTSYKEMVIIVLFWGWTLHHLWVAHVHDCYIVASNNRQSGGCAFIVLMNVLLGLKRTICLGIYIYA